MLFFAAVKSGLAQVSTNALGVSGFSALYALASKTFTSNVSEVSVAVSSAALAADEPKVVNAYAPTDKVIASARQRVKSFFIFIFLPFRNFFIYSRQALFVMPAKNKTNLAKTLPGKAEPAELICVFSLTQPPPCLTPRAPRLFRPKSRRNRFPSSIEPNRTQTSNQSIPSIPSDSD